MVNSWFTEGCDLWEEVRSDDFFFNRMAYVYSLNKCADFADLIGDDSGAADSYRGTASDIEGTLAVSAEWMSGSESKNEIFFVMPDAVARVCRVECLLL